MRFCTRRFRMPLFVEETVSASILVHVETLGIAVISG